MDKDIYKKCRRCNESKSLEDFGSDRSRSSGKTTYCKECNNKASHARQRNEKEYFRLYNQRWREQNPVRQMIINIRSRAKSAGILFTITEDDIEHKTHCPVTGVELDYSHGTKGIRNDNSPSLDRIDPTKGYEKGNVIIVSWRVNNIKNNATPEELINIGTYYRKLINGKKNKKPNL